MSQNEREQQHGCGCVGAHDHHHDEEGSVEEEDPLYAEKLKGLITDDGDDITPALHSALSDIFDRYDRGKKGGWTLDGALQRFAKKTQNGRKFSPSALKAISQNYKLSDDKKQLARNGFFQMCMSFTS